jgi:hypothetical protein
LENSKNRRILASGNLIVVGSDPGGFSFALVGLFISFVCKGKAQVCKKQVFA